MRTFKNDIGCSMSFEEGISNEQIKVRLGMFGSYDKWREVGEYE